MSGCSMGMGRETLENDVLRVGMHLDIDKMCYLSKEDNQPEGFEVELAGILADKMGMELEIVDTTEENLLKSLDGEVYDCVLSSVGLSQWNTIHYGHTRPYLDLSSVEEESGTEGDTQIAAFTRKGNSLADRKFSGRYAGRISGRTERRWKSFPAFHEIFRGRPYDIMVPGSKGLSPHELAHKWVKDLGIGPDDTDPLSSGNNF